MGGNSLGRSLPADQQAQIRLLGEAGFLQKNIDNASIHSRYCADALYEESVSAP